MVLKMSSRQKQNANNASLREKQPNVETTKNPSRRSNPNEKIQEFGAHKADENQIEVDDVEDIVDDLQILEDEEGGKRVCGIYIPPPIPAYCSAASKGARLIIKKISNYNFKSYAGVVELGPFHQCFTSIIGPNGSGKSNVIDSMLFVFGYRANRIRCKKISTLIHNSNKHANVRECYVAVHFVQIEDRENGSCAEIPNSKFVIQRNASSDNSSYYSIDGRRVQFKEVSKLLKSHNVDLDHNRFLILQGEVESIAMMKPKGQTENECGMLEYLEDIIGTNRYIKPLEQLSDMVNKLNIERGEKFNRFRLAETEVNDLKDPYEAACSYLKEENKNTHTLNKMYQKYILNVKNGIAKITEKHDEADKQLKEHDETAEALKNERKEKEEVAKKETMEFENLRKNKDVIEKKLEKCTSSFNAIQSEMASMNKQRKKNKTTVENNEKELAELKKLPEKNEKEIVECETKVEKLMKQRAELETVLETNYTILKEETEPLIKQRDSLETKLIDLRKHVDDAKGAVALTESELKVLTSEEVNEARKYQSLKSGYENTAENFEELKKQQIELRQQIPTLQKEIITKTNTLKQQEIEEKNMQAQLIKLKSEINERVTVAESFRSNNKVLNFLMRQKSEGNIHGVLGRLGDLGGIDAKYDVAISTACGRLDNIVVETVQAAQDCIEALKKYDVGRATFIALEKVQHFANAMGRINSPENAPRLFDLVRVEDQRVLPAFYFALHNTLVATDLEQGTRIAYGARRFRVVTIVGEMIETSGTMSGGGRVQLRGKMGTKVQTVTKPTSTEDSITSQKALEEMKDRAQELQNSINFCQEEQSRLEQEIRRLRQTLQQSERDLEKADSSIIGLEGHLPALLKQLKSQEERMNKTKSDASKVKALEAEIASKTSELKDREKAADKVSKEVSNIKEKIDKIHDEKVKSVQAKMNSLDTQIKKLNANVSKLKVNIATNERNMKKIETSTESLLAEIEQLQSKIKELNEDRQKYDDEADALSKELEEANLAIESAQKQSSNVQKEIIEIEKKEGELKLKRVEIEKAVNDLAAQLKENQAKIPFWRAKMAPLRLNEIPNDPNVEPLKTYTDEELENMDMHQLQYTNTALEEVLKKKPNLSIINEYQEKIKILYERQEVYVKVVDKLKDMRDTFDEVRKNRFREFTMGFRIISCKLKEMYQMITQGGDAELEMVDSMDPFTEGINFSVRPPRKSWKIISNLSGGEKTLSSLALVFALHYYKPSPLYFMDEIDAALDFKNISIVAHYIKERTKNAQFIIISLRNNMFELSDYLVGIYKVHDCTNSVSIKNEYIPLAPQQTQTQTQQPNRNNQNQFSRKSQDQEHIPQHERSQELGEATPIEDNCNEEIPIMPVTTQSLTVEDLILPASSEEQKTPSPDSISENVLSQEFTICGNVRETIFVPECESTTINACRETSKSLDTSDVFRRPLPPAKRDGQNV